MTYKTSLRSHTCGELTKDSIGKEVTLCGWVSSRRDHGGVIFIDLRDKFGITQIVFSPTENKETHATAEQLRREDCIKVTGLSRARAQGMENPNLETGAIEVIISDLVILNKSETPPIEIDDRKIASEEMRLKYRYLDLRRSEMQKHLQVRSKAAMAARNTLTQKGFTEIETPLLMKSTPEGARDYVVPSRVNPGKFYALPQSPQLYKQILMASGCDRYFQIAKCLRDEDLRADRQPEFTQIDMEMSFVSEEDVFAVAEDMMKDMFKEAIGKEVSGPFQRLPYKEAMEKYGSDKPDLRYELHITNVTDIVKNSDFGVFKAVAESGGVITCINPEENFGRKEIDAYISYCQDIGSKGMAWMRVTQDGLESNIAKYFSPEIQKQLKETIGAKAGSVLFFIADKKKAAYEIIGKLRQKVAKDLKLYDPSEFKFAWIVDFPLFEFDEEEKKWVPAHHMFTMPKKECMKFLESDPEKVIASCYDLVLNGVELASGSIRVHDPEIQKRIMDVVGFPQEEAEERFGFLLEAFKYGAPPHAGWAIGFDRLVAMMLGFHDIREVIAFPKNKNAQCPMDESPSNVPDEQLKDLHIKKSVIGQKKE